MKVLVRQDYEVSAKRRAEACKCPKQCKKYITLVGDEMITVCINGAISGAVEILRAAGVVAEDWKYLSGWGLWTIAQEEELIQYYRQHDPHYGVNSMFAQRFGKTREQVKHKVQHMRKQGRIPAAKKKNL